MKKLVILLTLFLVGCEYYEVDCEKYPSATVCQPEEVEKPIVEIEEPVVPEYDVCEEYPGHAECIEPFSSFRISEYTLPSEYSFDTFVSMRFYLSGDQHPIDYQSIAIRLSEKYHQLSNKYDAYEGVVNVKTINDNPAEKHFLEPELYELIKFSIANYETSQGYFDISINPVSTIWHDYRVKCEDYYFNEFFCNLPTDEEIAESSQYVGVDGIILNDEEMSIQMSEGMSLDLGAVSKGYFAEKLAEKFAQRGLRAFIINAGGNIKTYGEKPDGTLYTIAIQDPTKPRGEGALEFGLELPGGYSAVSSGDQEKYYIVDGEIYHHIINPYTNWPDRYFRQVTIVTNDSRAADILSTTVYLMPLEEGLAFVNSLDNVEALWVGIDGEITKSEFMDDFIG